MLSVSLSFVHQRVVIIGGGKQAWRKGKKLLDQGALVTFYAESFLEEIPEAMREYGSYHKGLLNNAFLVYACCDDPALNHQIVLDALQQQILCASIHQDEEASFHILRQQEFPHLQVALSTKGAAPAYGEVLMKEIQIQYEQRHHEILESLNIIRTHVLKTCQDLQTRSTFLKQLVLEPKEWIFFLSQAIKKKQAFILCFHGNGNQETLDCLHQWVKTFPYPATFAYLKPCAQVKSIEEVKEVMQYLQLPTVYDIITLEDGRIAQMIKAQLANEAVRVNTLTQQDIQRIIAEYQGKQVVFVLHESKSNQLYERMNECLPQGMQVMKLHEEFPVCDPEKEVLIVPLLLLRGKHFVEDILSNQGLLGLAQQQYQKVRAEENCLMEQDYFQRILNNKLLHHWEQEKCFG